MKVKRVINAEPERVYAAWLSEKSARDWWFRTPAGQLVCCEIDGRVGGTFHIIEKRAEMLADHFGRFVELVQPTLIVFEFATSPGQTPTPVTIRIERQADGSEVTLSHAIDPEWEHFRERIRAGWMMILENLENSLTHRRIV